MPELSEIYKIPLGHIKISDLNVRHHQKKVGIDELADSIKKHTLLQPIALKGKYGNPPYFLIIGQRRFNAYKLLYKKYGEKFDEIKAYFVPEDLTDIDLTILSLSENVHRADLNYADKAKVITYLYNHFSKNVKKVANEIGWAEGTVRDYIKIEEIATDKMKEIREKTNTSKIDMKRAIKAAAGNPKKAEKLFENFLEYDLTKYEKERAVEFGEKNPSSSVSQVIHEAITPKLEETIILALSSAVNDALSAARRVLELEREEIAIIALEDWLKRNGFMN